jgi:hypothetical protein
MTMEKARNDELQPLVDAIARRGLVEPAIFLFEMSKPLIGCARELYSFGEPLFSSFIGASLVPALKQAFRSAEDTEALITLLEETRDRSARIANGQQGSS